MMEQIKLLSMTAILTLLIWAGADSLVTETATIGVTFEPAPATPESEMLVRAETPGMLFELQLHGPRRTVEVAREAAPIRLRWPVADRPTGKAAVALDRDTLEQQLAAGSREFQKLSVGGVQPTELPLMVDHMVRREVEITAGRLALTYEGRPRIEPAKVAVRMRESKLKELEAAGQWQVLDVSSEFERLIREKPAGVAVTVVVPLDPRAYGPDAEFAPKAVEVTAAVQSTRTQAEIPAVPIRLAMSFSTLRRGYQAVTADGTELTLVTQTISVAGPAEEIGRLVRGDTRAYGVIQLRDTDLAQLGVLRSFEPEFQLPRGVELTRKPAPIEFKLVEVGPGGGK